MKTKQYVCLSITLLAGAWTVRTLQGQSHWFEKATSEWPLANGNLAGDRDQPREHEINSSTVRGLTAKWVFTTGGDVSATPTVAGNAVYFPDWAGNLYALNKDTGQLIWSQRISTYVGESTAVSRVSPAVYRGELILGDNGSPRAVHDGAKVFALDRQTGALRWMTKVDSYPAAIITGSPIPYAGVVYVGVSSNEESTLAAQPGYPCCAFRGSVVALDAENGGILWKTYDVPDNHGAIDQYSGGAIWQPPAIDTRRGLLYIGTGNNYTVPASVEACERAAQAANDPDKDCTAPDDYVDAALALDLQTGAVKWSHKHLGEEGGAIDWDYKVEKYDAWTIGCFAAIPINCPTPKGHDYDLGGSGPNLIENMVGFGQKSGKYWAFDPDSGRVLWSTLVAPAGNGTLGGIEWGTATDGKRIYTSVADSGKVPYQLVPSGLTINWGSWSALDAQTGKILWQTADPVAGAIDFGAVTVANGVVYAGSQAASGTMYALDAQTGSILWNFASGGSIVDGPSIADGAVYWGSGYYIGNPNNKLYAFSIPQNP